MYPQDVVVRLLLPLVVSGDLVLGGQPGQPGEGSGAPGAEGEHATSCQQRHGGTRGEGDWAHKILHFLLSVKLFISLKFSCF